MTKTILNQSSFLSTQNNFKKISAFVFMLMIFISFGLKANSIIVDSVSPSQWCAGSTATVSVTFSKTGTFFPGNVFTAQLSSSTGSFANPVDIGSVTSTNATPINVNIPAGTPAGSGYLIRIIGSNNSNSSTNTHITISKNFKSFTINPAIVPSISISITSGANPGCLGSSVEFTASPINEGANPVYQWQINGLNAGTNSPTFLTSGTANGDIVNCILNSNAVCASTTGVISNSITMVLSPAPLRPGTISGPKIVCGLSSATYAVPAVAGATSYNWILPTGMTISSGLGTRNITVNISPSFTSGNVSVASVNSCGNSPLRTAAISIIPAIPNTVSGPAMVCGLTSATYSIPAAAGATSYFWTVPAGISIVSGQGTRYLSVSFSGFTSGNISVNSINSCGSSTLKTLALYTRPKVPGLVSGPTMVCGASSATYSISPVLGATSYNWTVPSGVSINSGQGTTSLSVNFSAFSSGNISVAATNNCGTSPLKSLAISTIPKVPVAISGPAMVCGLSSATYSISAVAGATSYNWNVPSGVSIISGQGTTSLSVGITTFISGIISVSAVNDCGASPLKSLALYTKPKVPGIISGPTMVCGLSSATYSISAVAGATSYNWNVPSGVSIISGQGTTSLSVSIATFTSGIISVSAVNDCGASPLKSLALYTKPKVPGIISGPTMVCGLSSDTYSISSVLGATSYDWIAPAGVTILSGQGTTSITVSIDPGFASGNINVRATNGCGTSNARILSLSGCRMSTSVTSESDDSNDGFNFSIYPNPNDGSPINLQFTGEDQNILVTIYDVTGKESYSKMFISGENANNVFAIDPSDKLLPGIYIVTAASDQKTYSKKLIIK